MSKLDWSRGYTQDPGRVRGVEDFSHPDPVIVRGGKGIKCRPAKKVTGSSTLEQRAKRMGLTQADLLKALGFTRTRPKLAERGKALKKLVADGLLLKCGLPNPDHPRVIALLGSPVSKRIKRKK